MYELKKMERYLRVNLLGPGPCLIKKKNLPDGGLTKVEKHCCTSHLQFEQYTRNSRQISSLLVALFGEL